MADPPARGSGDRELGKDRRIGATDDSTELAIDMAARAVDELAVT